MKDDQLYIKQILDSIAKAESFTKGLSQEEFLNKEIVQSAVILQLALIGELSKKISNEFKEKIDLPWKDIAGFRDKAIHHYFEINLKMVWNTVADDIPTLKVQLEKIVI